MRGPVRVGLRNVDNSSGEHGRGESSERKIGGRRCDSMASHRLMENDDDDELLSVYAVELGWSRGKEEGRGATGGSGEAAG